MSTMIKFHYTESGARFLNNWNKSFNEEFCQRFGKPFYEELPIVKSGDSDTLKQEVLSMLQSTVFLAAFPQPAIIVDETFVLSD